MKSLLSLTLIAALVASAVPVAGQGQRDNTPAGPIQRAATRAAFRLATDVSSPPASDAGRKERRQADWSHVRGVEGAEVMLTVYGAPPGKRYVVRGTVNDAGLTVLNLTEPQISGHVRNAMADLATKRPDYLRLARLGRTVELNRRVRLASGGVFLDDRRVIELEQVVQDVTRISVAEIVRVHSATSQGMGWGALAGVSLGLAAVLGSCGFDWNHETDSCGNLSGALPFFGAFWGFAIGGVVGANSRTSTVIYRGPETESMRPSP